MLKNLEKVILWAIRLESPINECWTHLLATATVRPTVTPEHATVSSSATEVTKDFGIKVAENFKLAKRNHEVATKAFNETTDTMILWEAEGFLSSLRH